MKSPVCTTTTLIAACFLLAGCGLFGPSDGDDLEPGTSDVRVTGYVDRSFRGEAVFQTLRGMGGEPIFFLMLRDVVEPGEDYRIVEFAAGPKPDAGTHALADLADLDDPDEAAPGTIMGRYYDSESYGGFKSAGGTLEISFASERVLRGTFDFPAYELVPKNGGEYERVEVRVTGEFYAEEGDTGIIMN